MAHLLRIDSSSRLQDSHSRGLADEIQAAWQARHPGGQVTRRDLVVEPLPHISDATIAGFFTPEDQQTTQTRAATGLSDRLIAELQAADTILIGVPMYNFSVPSALKAWIDHIVRIGHTFGFDPEKGLHGLLGGKAVLIAAAYGASGYVDNGPYAAMDFLAPYLRGLFNFLGLSEVEFFAVEGSSTDPAAMDASLKKTREDIAYRFGATISACAG
ncbi:NAD(P)H-dependent oxidoreductase [Ferrovibrio sp.]|uniref:FMN-dependent NADH-azoreductase n=1 Tax=Ferrovibrio sp. TaxID=1917215 RepID=UPI00261829CA|nr:NAD(P)H-dependent oxidoreductase [Ferrovibrio sp.]